MKKTSIAPAPLLVLAAFAAALLSNCGDREVRVSESAPVEFRLAEEIPGEGLEERAFDGRIIYLHKEVLISAADMDTVSPGRSCDGMSCMNVRFKNSSTAKVAAVTSANVGKMLAMLVDRKVIMAPVIRCAISSDAAVTGRFSEQDIRDLMDRFAGK